MCARAVSKRGAKRRSPPLRHPRTVFLPVSALQAVAESSVGCLHGWRYAVACPLLACACSFGRWWQRSRVQAKSEYTHTGLGRSLANSGQSPTRDKTSIVDYSVGWHLETNSFHQHMRLI